MTTQLDIQGELNLTQVAFTLNKLDGQVLRFVTSDSYADVVRVVLLVTRDFVLGVVTQDHAVRRIVAELTHFPVLGDEVEVRDYIDVLGGHHVHADYAGNQVFIGHNTRKDTWGRVGIGGWKYDIIWDDGADVNGPAELEG